jgi:cobalamin synthase
MLPDAAQLARLLLAVTDKGFVKQKAKATLVKGEAWIIAGVMAVVAAVFFLMAAFMALQQVMPDWAAALLAGLLATLLAGIAVLVARHDRQPPPHHDETMQRLIDHPDEVITTMLAPLLDEVVNRTRERPAETALLALAAGLVAGRLTRKPRD